MGYPKILMLAILIRVSTFLGKCNNYKLILKYVCPI